MSDKDISALISFDAEQMPTQDRPQFEVCMEDSLMPVVAIKNRKFTESEDLMHIEGIETTIGRFKDKIGVLQAHIKKYEEILKWAREKGTIAETAQEL